jgi:hypothetical protein
MEGIADADVGGAARVTGRVGTSNVPDRPVSRASRRIASWMSRWPASAGSSRASPSGRVSCTASGRPRAIPSATHVSSGERPPSPRSIRLIAAWLTPTRAPSAAWVNRRRRRPRRASAPRAIDSVVVRRAVSRWSSVVRRRVDMATSCRPRVAWRLSPTRWTLPYARDDYLAGCGPLNEPNGPPGGPCHPRGERGSVWLRLHPEPYAPRNPWSSRPASIGRGLPLFAGGRSAGRWSLGVVAPTPPPARARHPHAPRRSAHRQERRTAGAPRRGAGRGSARNGEDQLPPGVTSTSPFWKDVPVVSASPSSASAASARSVR